MIKINLLATRDVKKTDTMQQQIIIAVIALLITLGIIAFLHIGITNSIAEKTEKIKIVSGKIKKLEVQAKALKAKKIQAKKIQNRKKVIKNLRSERYGPAMVLDELAKVLHEELWIEKLKLNGRNLSITGFTTNNDYLAQSMEGLDKSYFFRNVLLTQSKRPKGKKSGVTVYAFSLNMKVNYPKMREEKVK